MSRKQPNKRPPPGTIRPKAPPAPPRPSMKAEHPRWTMAPPSEAGLYWYSLRTKDYFEGGVVRNCRVWMARPYGGGSKQLVAEGADGKLCPVAQFQRWWSSIGLLEVKEE